MEPTDTPAAAASPPPDPPRNDNPARDTWVASLLDPAFDKAHENWRAACDRYVATRALADLAKLPTLPEQWPTLWRLRPLTAIARTLVYSNTNLVGQRHTALRLALVARVDGPRTYVDGAVANCKEERLAHLRGAAVPQVEEAAIDAQVNEFGGLWLDEIGEIVIHRTNAPRKVYLPFPQPLPSQLL